MGKKVERPPCGTHKAVVSHRRHGEPIDDLCKAADAAYCAQWRQANPESRLLTVRKQNARWRAMQRLAKEYPDHFSRFLAAQGIESAAETRVTQKRRAMRDMARSFPTRYDELVEEEMTGR